MEYNMWLDIMFMDQTIIHKTWRNKKRWTWVDPKRERILPLITFVFQIHNCAIWVAAFSAHKSSIKSPLSPKCTSWFSTSLVVSIDWSNEKPWRDDTTPSRNSEMMSSRPCTFISFSIIMLWMIQHANMMFVIMSKFRNRDGFWRIANYACNTSKHRSTFFCTASCRSTKINNFFCLGACECLE